MKEWTPAPTLALAYWTDLLYPQWENNVQYKTKAR